MLTLRRQHPRDSKAKQRVLLCAQGMVLSASTIGRVLANPIRHRLLIEPHAVRVRHRRSHRPSATRGPTARLQPTAPGQLIQLDTMHLRPEPGIERCH